MRNNSQGYRRKEKTAKLLNIHIIYLYNGHYEIKIYTFIHLTLTLFLVYISENYMNKADFFYSHFLHLHGSIT